MSQRQMRLISAIGTGLLVGTALIVIIPEGIETLYSAETLSLSPSVPLRGATAAISLHNNNLNPEDRYTQAKEAAQNADPAALRIRAVDYKSPEENALSPALSPRPPLPLQQVRADLDTQEHRDETSSHAWVGISLTTGFILMYLIDALPELSSSKRGQHIPLATLEGDTPTEFTSPSHAPHSHSTTIGLVIHSFADGIALGASSATPSTQDTLGLIVFIAILVHKAPAAFGLTAVLLKEGVSKRAARGHLLVFSIAAPLGALMTWTLLNLLGNNGVANDSSGTWFTGIVLVFSGGTFLYVHPSLTPQPQANDKCEDMWQCMRCSQ